MVVPRPTPAEIADRIYNSILRLTPITAGLDSSIIGVIVKTTAAELDLLWAQVEEIGKQTQLTTATGPGLDRWGEMIGTPRKQAIRATSLGSSRSVRFTNNGAGAVTIPQGTRVWKSSNPQLAFFTSEGLSLTAGQQSEVHVSAADFGEIFNVGIGELTRHNVPNVSVNVTNILPISNGSLTESDAAYRSRLLQEYRRRVVFNRDTAAGMLLSVPGVQDVLIREKTRGPGTYDAIIVPYLYSETNNVVSSCQVMLDEYSPVGVSAIAKPPVIRNLDIVVKLKFKVDTETTKESARQIIRDQIQSLISTLPIEDGSQNGTLFLSQIKGIALSADRSIIDAVVEIGLDGSAFRSEGELRLDLGERLVVRGLTVN
jgi:uncharacterized phage protein gp47/JayE